MLKPLRILSAWISLAAACLFCACAGSMNMKKPEQGLFGTFTTYGPPETMIDCGPLVTQAEKDSCKKQNQRFIEEPYRSTIRIRNLGTGETVKQALDAQGSYRLILPPGEYEVCVGEECSDPLEVRMRNFTTYGQRLPRASAPGDKSPADTSQASRSRLP
ncbi:MAG: hypothetical protein JWO30_3543 [Fibrobacteres bacterium]|nr:hypothetical protein [Fibrobacterota bacterium]